MNQPDPIDRSSRWHSPARAGRAGRTRGPWSVLIASLLAALLHGIGFVMITRLDDHLAGLQSVWSLIGIGVFVLTLLVVQRAPDLARYKWILFFIGAGRFLSVDYWIAERFRDR